MRLWEVARITSFDCEIGMTDEPKEIAQLRRRDISYINTQFTKKQVTKHAVVCIKQTMHDRMTK